MYLVTLLLPSLAYAWVQRIIRRTGRQTDPALAYHRQALRKGVVSTVLYLFGIPLTLVSPWLGIACAGLVALLWILPSSRLDRLFGDRA